ncbi:MAG: FAD-dependent oxidoreductase [Desulfobacterales bacterium]|nr:FAD-dependent oxidoreductase [Desulfobacterales bacterium]
MNRLSQLPTLRINPEQKISLKYNGKTYQGVSGDTVATALFAGGVRVFSRSLKYHRPRGLYSLDGECSNTYMQVNGIPNVRAEDTPLKSGMIVKAQNVKGTPENDLLGVLDKLDWAMPAGFYYRTMHKPAQIWPVALRQVRKAAGLGKISPKFHMKGNYDEIYPQAEVCVIGGGPAGMSAALAAAEQKLRVILLESRPWLGGFFDYRPAEYDGSIHLFERGRQLAKMIEESPNIRHFAHTATIGAYNNNLITAFQVGADSDHFDERYLEIRAQSVVVATGCIERPLLFGNNERPGVMQIGCAHRLARTYGLLPGKNAVFSIGHDLGIEAALDLFDLGLKISCIADIREDGQNPGLVAGLAAKKIPFLRGWVANEVHGGRRLNKVTISTLQGTHRREVDCDLLVASAGMTPVIGPLSLGQAQLEYNLHTGFFLPTKLPAKMHAAGRLLGLNDPVSIEASGQLAGLLAAADCGASVKSNVKGARKRLYDLPGRVRGSKLVQAPVKSRKSFICFDEDTTIKNVDQALKMGFDATELIKRFTAAGTGPGQGGISGHNLPLYVAQSQGGSHHLARPTTVRAPLVPIYLATAAGSNHDMCKRTAVNDSQKSAGGIMRRIGVWKRARYFSRDFSCRKEIENVRNNVGMLDASTLGKFRIWGPDALKALQRVYIGNMANISDGKVKYSAMCNEDGCIIDDGVVVKRQENDYYFTTSTGRAGGTVEWFRYHSRYDGWNYHMVNLTDALGVINLAGPKAREVLGHLVDTDVSNGAIPYAGYRELTIKDTIPVQVMRLGFVGELSYELHVPASYMQSLWELITDAGKPFDIQNFGLEAQNVLRMEKGHIIIGSESEQRTTLHDVGLGFLWDRTKTEAKSVGAVALRQTESQEGRLTLVGFKMEDTFHAPKDGSIIVDSRIRGHVCIARYSYVLDESVGLALVDSALAKEGTRLQIYENDCHGRHIYARVSPIPFYDPEGKRLRS